MRAIFCTILFLFMFSIGPSETASTQTGENDVILVQGHPPLTQSMVNNSIDLLEWSLAVPFSPEHKSKIQQVLIDAWRANDRAQISSTLGALDIRNQVAQMNQADRNYFREKFRATLLQTLNAGPKDELTRVVLDAYEAARSTGPKPSGPTSNSSDRPRRGADEQGGTAATKKAHSSVFWRYSDGQALLTAEEAEAVLRRNRPTAAAGGRTLGFDEAINNARRFLNKHAGPKALAAFNSSPQARDAERAAAAAGGAMIYGKPLAALAALLRAHELQPQNATHLANLAAVLGYMGMPLEALAILDSPVVKNGQIASPLGAGGQAGVHNTRGYALLQLGRARDAEEALRRATAQSPQLAEVKTNLAFALWAQDDPRKKEEATRLIAALWRRTRRPNSENNADRKTPPGGPARPDPEEITGELFTPVEAGATNLDLSRGKRLRIPDLKIPASLEDSVAMHPKYQKLMRQVAGIQSTLAARSDQLHETITERLQKDLERAQGTADPLQAMNSVIARQKRFEALDELIDFESVKRHPAVRPYWEKARQSRLNDYQGVNFEQQWLVEEMPAGVADRGSQSKQLAKKFHEWKEAEQAEKRANIGQYAAIEKKYKQMRCAATREAHARWRSGIHDFDTAHRNFLQAAYKHMTAVVANIADRSEHELAQIRVERDIYTAWHDHILDTDSFYSRADSALKYDCGESPGRAEGEDLQNLKAEKADSCPDALKGNNKAKVDLEVIEVSFNCEQIGVELSADVAWWVGLFTEVTVTFEGEITVTAGVKTDVGLVGIPGVGVPSDIGAKAGVYVKIGEEKEGWVIKDVGVSGEVSASRGTGPFGIESSSGFEYSYLPSVSTSGLNP